jgi:hypothetical protein
MSRGPDGGRTEDIGSARRRGSRRAAAAHARQEQRRRLRAIERKHTRRFLRLAARVAKRSSGKFGWKVQVERTGGGGWPWGLVRWTEAVVQLVPMEVSVRFSLADKRGSSSSNAIRVYAGRRLVRPCPAQLLQSGDRRAFAAWLGETLVVAAKRSPGSGE